MRNSEADLGTAYVLESGSQVGFAAWEASKGKPASLANFALDLVSLPPPSSLEAIQGGSEAENTLEVLRSKLLTFGDAGAKLKETRLKKPYYDLGLRKRVLSTSTSSSVFMLRTWWTSASVFVSRRGCSLCGRSPGDDGWWSTHGGPTVGLVARSKLSSPQVPHLRKLKWITHSQSSLEGWT